VVFAAGGSGSDSHQKSETSGKGFGPSYSKQRESELFHFHAPSTDKSVATQFLRPSSIPKPPQSKTTRAFDRLLEFPCQFEIKVIGEADGSFDEDILVLVGKVRFAAISHDVYKQKKRRIGETNLLFRCIFR